MDLATLEARLRALALGYPEACEEFPWGERVIKVRGKIFLFLGETDGHLRLAVKLPASHEFALMFDFISPTGYGLGKSGWVSIALHNPQDLDPDLLDSWIDESYRAIAPKRLAKTLPSRA